MKPEKIWLLKDKWCRKYRIYQNENRLIKAISPDTTTEILEFELKNSFRACDFLSQRERDTRIRAALGELDNFEENAIKFINLYIELAPDNIRISYGVSKQEIIKRLKKYGNNKELFKKLLINYKKHFIIDVSHSLEWYTALLKVHNFRDCQYNNRIWDSNLKKYVHPTIPDEIKNNFNKAKKNKK